MKVLICDDHRLLVDALATIVRARGHETVDPAYDPDSAVAAVAATDVDVCVMDVGFPTADGIDGIRRVLSASPHTRVVVLSGTAEPDVVEAALAAGAGAYVVKSDDIDRILSAIERARLTPRPNGSGGSSSTVSRPAWRSSGEQLVQFLTPREREVLERLVRGQSTSAMAREMGVAYSTARTHIQNVLTKLGVHSKLAAVTFAVQHGIVTPGSAKERAGRTANVGSIGA